MTRLRRTLTRLLAALLAALALAPSTIGTAGAVVNGRVAPDGVLQRDWYFYAQIELNGATWCGGSVISINSVLTAAHCVDGTVRADQLTVVLESVLAPEGGEIRRDVAAIEIEPSWTGSTGIDLAILRLENEVDEIGFQSSPVPGNYVIPLAEGDRQAGDIADVAGRGLTSRSGSASADVKEARMEIVADADCNVNPSLGNRQVCFQPHSDHDASGLTCNGDSGGPITTWNHARQSFVLFAVVNMGNCTDRTIGASVVDNRTWIDQEVDDNFAFIPTTFSQIDLLIDLGLVDPDTWFYAQGGDDGNAGSYRVEVIDNPDGAQNRVNAHGFTPGCTVRFSFYTADGSLLQHQWYPADANGWSRWYPTDELIAPANRIVLAETCPGSSGYVENAAAITIPNLDITDINLHAEEVRGVSDVAGEVRIAASDDRTAAAEVVTVGSDGRFHAVLDTDLGVGTTVSVELRDDQSDSYLTITTVTNDYRVEVIDNPDGARNRVNAHGFTPGCTVRFSFHTADGSLLQHQWYPADANGWSRWYPTDELIAPANRIVLAETCPGSSGYVENAAAITIPDLDITDINLHSNVVTVRTLGTPAVVAVDADGTMIDLAVAPSDRADDPDWEFGFADLGAGVTITAGLTDRSGARFSRVVTVANDYRVEVIDNPDGAQNRVNAHGFTPGCTVRFSFHTADGSLLQHQWYPADANGWSRWYPADELIAPANRIVLAETCPGSSGYVENAAAITIPTTTRVDVDSSTDEISGSTEEWVAITITNPDGFSVKTDRRGAFTVDLSGDIDIVDGSTVTMSYTDDRGDRHSLVTEVRAS